VCLKLHVAKWKYEQKIMFLLFRLPSKSAVLTIGTSGQALLTRAPKYQLGKYIAIDEQSYLTI